MGVDYFHCNHCKQIIADCGEYYTFDIEEYDEYTICPICLEEVKSLLKISPGSIPDRSCFLQEKETGKKQVFKSLKALKKHCGQLQVDKYTYGLFRRNPEHVVIQSFLEEPCGMSEQEAREELEKLCEKGVSFMSNNTAYIGWRGKKEELTIYNIVKDKKGYHGHTVDDCLDLIRNHIRRHRLEDVSYIITGFGGLPKYHYDVLKDFRFPEESENLIRFETLEELTTSFVDQLHISDLTWRYTQKFIDFKMEGINSEIERLQEQKKKLEEINLEPED